MYIRIYEEDRDNAIRNLLTVEGGEMAYNAVISVIKSDEIDGADPVTEPVILQEAKDWCRIDINDDDVIVTLLIKAARKVCERYANLSFVPRTITARLKNGAGGINLPYGPLVGNIITVTDKDGNSLLTVFDLDNGYSGIITLTYNAGYTILPEDLKNALLCQIAWMYKNRGDARVAGNVSELSKLILNSVRNV